MSKKINISKDKYSNLLLKEDIHLAKILKTKLDLTIYSDRELELQVFNTSDLYQLITDLKQLKKEIEKQFSLV